MTKKELIRFLELHDKAMENREKLSKLPTNYSGYLETKKEKLEYNSLYKKIII